MKSLIKRASFLVMALFLIIGITACHNTKRTDNTGIVPASAVKSWCYPQQYYFQGYCPKGYQKYNYRSCYPKGYYCWNYRP